MPYFAPYQGKITVEPIPLTLYAIVSKSVGTWGQTTLILRSLLHVTDVCVDRICNVIVSLAKEAIAVCCEIVAHAVCIAVSLLAGLVLHYAMFLLLTAHAVRVVLRKGLGSLGTGGKLLAKKPLKRLFFSSMEVFPFLVLSYGVARSLGLGSGVEWKNTGGWFEHFFTNGIQHLHDEFREVVINSR